MIAHRPLVPQGPQLVSPPSRRLVYGSLALAWLASLLPWPGGVIWLVPDFTLVVLCYWLIHAPHAAGLGLALALGLLADAALGGLIGQHGLAYTVAAFLVVQLRRRLENFEVSGRALHLLPIFIGQQVLVLLVGLAFDLPDADWRYLAAGLTAALCWLPLAHLFDRLTGWSNEMYIEPAAR